MVDFTSKVDSFVKILSEMQLIVRRFDETITLKSNKTDFAMLRKECEDKFIDQTSWDKILKKYSILKENNEDQIELLYDKFKEYTYE